jgi:hypothetical protein
MALYYPAQAQLKLTDSVIRENWDWGIAAALTQCGFPYDAFTGTVTFEGTNIIEGNNRWGNQKGMGNPGSHPWNNPSCARWAGLLALNLAPTLRS